MRIIRLEVMIRGDKAEADAAAEELARSACDIANSHETVSIEVVEPNARLDVTMPRSDGAEPPRAVQQPYCGSCGASADLLGDTSVCPHCGGAIVGGSDP